MRRAEEATPRFQAAEATLWGAYARAAPLEPPGGRARPCPRSGRAVCLPFSTSLRAPSAVAPAPLCKSGGPCAAAAAARARAAPPRPPPRRRAAAAAPGRRARMQLRSASPRPAAACAPNPRRCEGQSPSAGHRLRLLLGRPERSTLEAAAEAAAAETERAAAVARAADSSRPWCHRQTPSARAVAASMALVSPQPRSSRAPSRPEASAAGRKVPCCGGCAWRAE